ncbi:MAG: protein phosphatase 2C domain-containing protein [bacterium]|nr:protein phosphatase 2C domain-containing protein [bacterium]
MKNCMDSDHEGDSISSSTPQPDQPSCRGRALTESDNQTGASANPLTIADVEEGSEASPTGRLGLASASAQNAEVEDTGREPTARLFLRDYLGKYTAGSDLFCDWKGIYMTAVGGRHLNATPSIPCQDAAFASTNPRPMIVVADGAGSAKLSHIGSEAIVKSLSRFNVTIDDINHKYLDLEHEPAPSREVVRYARRFVKHAYGVLLDMSNYYRHTIEDLRSTLILILLGATHLFWLKIGDGFIVVERDGKLQTLGPLGKGEFANQTIFVDGNLGESDISYGFVSIADITGVAAMTDGAAERLVSNDGLRVAGQIAQYLEELRSGRLDENRIHGFLNDRNVWRKTTGDDKGIALLSRKVPTRAP